MSRISKSVETGNRLVRGWERGEGKQNGECLLISTRFLLGVDENVLKFENLALELEYCPTLWIYKNIRLYTLKRWDFMVYELYFNKKKSNTNVLNLRKRAMKTITRVIVVKKKEAIIITWQNLKKTMNQLGDKLKIKQRKETSQDNCLNEMKYIIWKRNPIVGRRLIQFWICRDFHEYEVFLNGDAFRQLNIWDKSSSCWRHKIESHQLRGGSWSHGDNVGKKKKRKLMIGILSEVFFTSAMISWRNLRKEKVKMMAEKCLAQRLREESYKKEQWKILRCHQRVWARENKVKQAVRLFH